MVLHIHTGAAKDIENNLSVTESFPDSSNKIAPIYVVHLDGKKDWFYCMFGSCFAKQILDNNRYYHKVCCFQYSTDGHGSYGCHVPPGEVFPIDEPELYHPKREYCAILLCGLCLYYRWKKYSKNYKIYGERYADQKYYVEEKHYNYHACCSPDFAD